MTDGAVYSNTPLVSVAFELRHPTSEPLSQVHRTGLQKHLTQRFPLARPMRTYTQQVELGPLGPTTEMIAEEVPRFLSRSRRSAISFLQNSIVVETTDYEGWATFRKLIEYACAARNAVTPVLGIERLGLRYVDEVRPADRSASPGDWSDWIAPALLQPPLEAGSHLPMQSWQGVAAFGNENGEGLTFRYGPGVGFATDPNGEPRRVDPGLPGPFFLLDVDSFWNPTDEVPEYEIATVLKQVDILHEPVRAIFESSITDRYRAEVLDA